MTKQYMDISESDKKIIMMTGKFLAGKGYHKADVAILLIDTIDNIDNTEGKIE